MGSVLKYERPMGGEKDKDIGEIAPIVSIESKKESSVKSENIPNEKFEGYFILDGEVVAMFKNNDSGEMRLLSNSQCRKEITKIGDFPEAFKNPPEIFEVYGLWPKSAENIPVLAEDGPAIPHRADVIEFNPDLKNEK